MFPDEEGTESETLEQIERCLLYVQTMFPDEEGTERADLPHPAHPIRGHEAGENLASRVVTIVTTCPRK